MFLKTPLFNVFAGTFFMITSVIDNLQSYPSMTSLQRSGSRNIEIDLPEIVDKSYNMAKALSRRASSTIFIPLKGLTRIRLSMSSIEMMTSPWEGTFPFRRIAVSTAV